MKVILLAFCLTALAYTVHAQELYVNTEPASNMAARSLGIRLENQGYNSNGFKNRTTLEAMYGATGKLMLHGALYSSNFYQRSQRFEGGSFYAKYRFLSVDTVQAHFRGAIFGKVGVSRNPYMMQEIALEGDNSGLQGGVIFTKLIHKLAFSGSASYLRGLNSANDKGAIAGAKGSLAYTISAGYLLLPKNYTSYNQVNLNLYAELLGKTNPGYAQSYLDVAPALQLIFNSVCRLDFSYRTPLYNNMQRNSANMYLVRFEYNFFNL
ncbi:hypothetical protein EWM62_14475 [Mucilaginibacter terrigena]|uniref:DUF481 domain-containing protein n=1 Tax=Mucilaginibacter terrigena TaxID=2492395 RepID=A0A4Q5LJC0_9SPHI|nr:hypothetical protein [Mucilaginibacter terrigena]RYU89521.1 hypothetical protein EWM62_14475 [Mucilaginibacter terrigena]